MFCVYDHDRLSKHDLIGEARIPLCLVDLGKTIEEWKDLERTEVDPKAVSIEMMHVFNGSELQGYFSKDRNDRLKKMKQISTVSCK